MMTWKEVGEFCSEWPFDIQHSKDERIQHFISVYIAEISTREVNFSILMFAEKTSTKKKCTTNRLYCRCIVKNVQYLLFFFHCFCWAASALQREIATYNRFCDIEAHSLLSSFLISNSNEKYIVRQQSEKDISHYCSTNVFHPLV